MTGYRALTVLALACCAHAFVAPLRPTSVPARAVKRAAISMGPFDGLKDKLPLPGKPDRQELRAREIEALAKEAAAEQKPFGGKPAPGKFTPGVNLPSLPKLGGGGGGGGGGGAGLPKGPKSPMMDITRGLPDLSVKRGLAKAAAKAPSLPKPPVREVTVKRINEAKGTKSKKFTPQRFNVDGKAKRGPDPDYLSRQKAVGRWEENRARKSPGRRRVPRGSENYF